VLFTSGTGVTTVNTCIVIGDCTVLQVWKCCSPVELWCEADMKVHLWKYTQFAQFNTSDTMLLVSGVHPGDNGTMGEIAVFSTRRE